jgi:outer membrane protein assembly factor BamB
VVLTASRIVGITPDRGDLLWEFPWPYVQNSPQPLILGDRVFVSTSSGGGAVMIQLARDGDRFTARELWRTNRMKNNFSSSVHHDGFIYGLDEFILACIDAATGELKWKGGRYGYGQLMLASGHLIVTTEQGEIAVVRATPESHQEAVRFAAIEGQTYNHPAIVDGILLIRNTSEMAAFDLRRK